MLATVSHGVKMGTTQWSIYPVYLYSRSSTVYQHLYIVSLSEY